MIAGRDAAADLSHGTGDWQEEHQAEPGSQPYCTGWTDTRVTCMVPPVVCNKLPKSTPVHKS